MFSKNATNAFLLLVACGWIAVDSRSFAQLDQPLTAEQVRSAISGGVKYLLDEQSPNGTWDDIIEHPGGVTALCTLALLNSGVDPEHPQIQKALEVLRQLQPQRTYSVSLQTMVFCAATPERDLMTIQRNVRWLESTQLDGGNWSYPGAGGDNSNSQFAVLALHEAERAGATVQPETWQKAARHWESSQNADGSWGYQENWSEGTGSMTCAGIGALVITRGRVDEPNASVENGFVQCCQVDEEDDALENALTWLGRNFSVVRNPGPRNRHSVWHYYYLYGLERVGRLTARRLIGEHDWYREGAEFLIRQQDPFSHHWTGQGTAENNPHIATPLALLFLSKGRRPLLMAKVKHGPQQDWNNHANDVANLTAQAEQLWEMDLTWQILDPQQATVDELLQAPVLYLSGSRTPDLEGMETKVRDYLDRGGFLFAEACCIDGSGFEQGFREFLERVFPEEEYRLRRAGPEHPLWRVETFVRPESPYTGRLWTIEYGCRTCVVFSEIDLSCYWELYGRGREIEQLPEPIEQRLHDANAIGLNVLAYATNREPKGKETAFTGVENLAELETGDSRGIIQIAKLEHGGGCNDAPGALVNLLRAAAQGDLKLAISLEEFTVDPADPNLVQFIMAFMHGRYDFRFTPNEQEQLRAYLENGGTLFADSICASKPFVAAFRREINKIFPESPLQRIPADDPLFSRAVGGYDIQQVERREPAQQQGDQPMRARVRTVEPVLEGINIDGRWAVIFSPYDISCALEQHESLRCRGYTQEDAARIALNVLMYTLNPDAGELP